MNEKQIQAWRNAVSVATSAPVHGMVVVDAGTVLAIESALRAQAVPDGWMLVPVEPTEDMFVDGMEADCIGRPSIDDESHVRSIWSAMIQAAPQPAQAEQPKVAQQEPKCTCLTNQLGPHYCERCSP